MTRKLVFGALLVFPLETGCSLPVSQLDEDSYFTVAVWHYFDMGALGSTLDFLPAILRDA